MSVEKLELITAQGAKVNIELKSNEFKFEIDNGDVIWYWLDRSQAHLLMLYLQEKLTADPVIEKKLWYCPKCDRHHGLDYVCERLSNRSIKGD